MATKKKSKLTGEQVKTRAEAIRAYGLKKFMEDTGIKDGTLKPILYGHRDSESEETKRQSKATGIPLHILNPVSFGPAANGEFLAWLKEHLVRRKSECTDEEWLDIGATVKRWFK